MKDLKFANIQKIKEKIDKDEELYRSVSWDQLEKEFSQIKKTFYDVNIKKPKSDVHINVGGMSFVVGMDTLTSVDGSLLQNFFKEEENIKNEKIFIDREPEAFSNMLKYLRSDRKYIP